MSIFLSSFFFHSRYHYIYIFHKLKLDNPPSSWPSLPIPHKCENFSSIWQEFGFFRFEISGHSCYLYFFGIYLGHLQIHFWHSLQTDIMELKNLKEGRNPKNPVTQTPHFLRHLWPIKSWVTLLKGRNKTDLTQKPQSSSKTTGSSHKL